MEAPKQLSKIKMLVLGRFFVGKSSLLRIYKDEIPSLPKNEPRRNTIYLDMIYKNEKVDGQRFELLIFDLAGQEKFSLTLKSIHRNIRAALIVYSVDELASFEDVKLWIQQVREIAEDPVIYIIGRNSIIIDIFILLYRGLHYYHFRKTKLFLSQFRGLIISL